MGKRLFLDSGTLTPMLKKMEKAGWKTYFNSLSDAGKDEIRQKYNFTKY